MPGGGGRRERGGGSCGSVHGTAASSQLSRRSECSSSSETKVSTTLAQTFGSRPDARKRKLPLPLDSTPSRIGSSAFCKPGCVLRKFFFVFSRPSWNLSTDMIYWVKKNRPKCGLLRLVLKRRPRCWRQGCWPQARLRPQANDRSSAQGQDCAWLTLSQATGVPTATSTPVSTSVSPSQPCFLAGAALASRAQETLREHHKQSANVGGSHCSTAVSCARLEVQGELHVDLRDQFRCVRRLLETRALLLEDKQRVSPFYHPSVHQTSTLEKTKIYQYSILSSLMSVCFQQVGGARDSCHGKQRVSPFYRTSHLAYSEDFDFRIRFSPGFLMQQMISLMEPLQSNSSLVLTLL